MKYIATIYHKDESTSVMRNTEEEAKKWLNSQNRNSANKTEITILDEQLRKIGSYIYTEAINDI